MAVYKVPQDVEADDKLIGPFSFKQFVMILVACGLGYISFILWRASVILGLLPLPLAFAILAFAVWPRRKQPIEVYLAAIFHFWTKPRRRIWNQEGHVEHVVIRAPKVVERKYTDGLSQGEVHSNLENLARTLDSRGWSAKNVDTEESPYRSPVAFSPEVIATPPAYVDPEQVVAPSPIQQSDDIMDPIHNPVAQHFDNASQNAAQEQRQAAIESMQNASYDITEKPQDTSTIPEPPSAAILNLSENSDLSVSTLAKEAQDVLPNDTTIELRK